MTITTSRTLVAAGVLALTLASLCYYWVHTKNSYLSITTFTACKNEGYPVTETNPAQCRTPDGRLFVEGSVPAASSSPNGMAEDMIRVTNVSPNQVIADALKVEGIARGGWYFEASFPVELLDGNGKQLASVPAQAKSDWMTNDFVPFSVVITFKNPTTATGTLVLHKDNPSGLSENDRELRIPVRFSTTERTVKLYYYNGTLDTDAQGTILCSSKGLVSVDRVIPLTKTPLRDTINLLLKGEQTPEERAAGITTEFPLANVTLVSASLSSAGLATLTFSDKDQKTSGGACRVGILRAAIEATALQFDTVHTVSIQPSNLFQP